MSTIYQETFATGTDKALVLSNEEAGRALEIGSDWTRIRIGCLIAIEPVGTANITNGQVRFGLSSAAGDHFGSQAADHWYGYAAGGLGDNYTGGTWTYTAGGGYPYFESQEGIMCSIVNGAFYGVSALNNGNDFAICTTTGTANRRFPFFIEYKKVTTTIVAACYAFDPVASSHDFLLSEVITTMEDSTDYSPGGALLMPCGGVNLIALVTRTFANYTANAALYGEIDSVQFGFNKAFNPFRLYSVIVARYE